MNAEEYEETQRQALHEHREDYIPIEMQCVECGKEGTGRCSCCGRPLCHMHMETQAAFCSNFGNYVIDGQEKTGCKFGEELYEFDEREENNDE